MNRTNVILTDMNSITPELIGVTKKIILDILSATNLDDRAVSKILYKYPLSSGSIVSKSQVLVTYKKLKLDRSLTLEQDQEKKLLEAIKMKHIRSASGVTPVTVLTKPYPCPGKCIFCPADVRMPKSYLANEPGAQRAAANMFDPYLQTFNRLTAYKNTGHPTDKIELIVLGGTWSAYPESYQIWFIKRCFDAMNDFDPDASAVKLQPGDAVDSLKSVQTPAPENVRGNYNKIIQKQLLKDLEKSNSEVCSWADLDLAHTKNVLAYSRCVGLVIETRPDFVTEEEVIRIRRLGATKVQIGIQSLSDKILKLNKRGHSVSQTNKAFELLRLAGFKIHAHWMANLYGSDPQKDINDFKKIFSNKKFRPDELKIYPCSLIDTAELVNYHNAGKWSPYSRDELLHVVSTCISTTPRYCRLTRVIRDIPSDDILVGNKETNFRQSAESYLKSRSVLPVEIRSREIKNKQISPDSLHLKFTKYPTSVSTEVFIEYVTPEDNIAAFLRLSLPKRDSFINELAGCAIIREVHVYGRSLRLGQQSDGAAQHSGLGKSLIALSKLIAAGSGYRDLAVISSIGTREYYKNRGFELNNLYQICHLDNIDKNALIKETTIPNIKALKKVYTPKPGTK